MKTSERTANGSKRIFWHFRRNLLLPFFPFFFSIFKKILPFKTPGKTSRFEQRACNCEIRKNCRSTKCLLLSFIAYQDNVASLSAIAMSFLILIVLVSCEMLMPLASINFANAAVIQEFERNCTVIEQEKQFFDSTAPLERCIRPWSHGIRCQENECVCHGGVISFGQFAELQQRLLSSDDRDGDKNKLTIHLTSDSIQQKECEIFVPCLD